MRTWLKLLGSPEDGMAETIVPQVLRLVRFPTRPTIQIGDKLVLYVLGYDKVFGIVEAFSPVREGEGDKPWDKWFLDVRRVMKISYADAPSLDAISVSDRDLRVATRQHSHIKLRDVEYQAAVDLLRARGAEEDSLYRAF
jgi:hypothetical protein